MTRQQGQIESNQARFEQNQARFEQNQARIEEHQVRIGENLISLTDIVQEVVEAQRRYGGENREAHRRFEAFHQEVDGRFNIRIKMMDEWICERRKGTARPSTGWM